MTFQNKQIFALADRTWIVHPCSAPYLTTIILPDMSDKTRDLIGEHMVPILARLTTDIAKMQKGKLQGKKKC